MSAITAAPEMPKPALEGLSETEAVRTYDAGEGNRLQASLTRPGLGLRPSSGDGLRQLVRSSSPIG